jgi:hypothetical protein
VYVTISLPLPAPIESITTQLALLVACQPQPLDEVTLTLLLPPTEGNDCDNGEIEFETSVLADVSADPQESGFDGTSEKLIGNESPNISAEDCL